MENKKAECLMNAVKLAPEGLMVEIGCIREPKEVPQDGFSTYYLGTYAKEKELVFRSFDVNPDNVFMGNKVLTDAGCKPTVDIADGKEILPTLGPIAFLYLDSHRIPQYSLEQYIAAELMPGAVVCIDDANTYDGYQFGKATMLIDLWNNVGIQWKLQVTEPGFGMVWATIPEGKQSGQAR